MIIVLLDNVQIVASNKCTLSIGKCAFKRAMSTYKRLIDFAENFSISLQSASKALKNTPIYKEKRKKKLHRIFFLNT
jgi:hypothetical protein